MVMKKIRIDGTSVKSNFFLEIYLPKLLKSKLIPENTPVSQDYLKESESRVKFVGRPFRRSFNNKN